MRKNKEKPLPEIVFTTECEDFAELAKMNSEAARTYERIKNLETFMITGAVKIESWNQHHTRYTFSDGSRITIYPRTRMAYVHSNPLEIKINGYAHHTYDYARMLPLMINTKTRKS